MAVSPKGNRNLLQHFQACFLKCHFCKSPGPVRVFWGGGDKYKKSCAYARNIGSRPGLGYNEEFNGEGTFTSPGLPGPHCPQQAEPAPPFLAEGRREITAGSRDPSTHRDVGAPEPSTHELNSLSQSSSILSPIGDRGILVLPQRGAQHENLACVSAVPALGGFQWQLTAACPALGTNPG